MKPQFSSKLKPVFDELIEERTARGVLTDEYCRVCNQLDKFIREQGADDGTFGKQLVTEFYECYLAKKLCRGYLQHIGKVLRDVALYLHNFKLTDGEIYYLENLKLPPKETKAQYYPSREEIAKLIAYLDQEAERRAAEGGFTAGWTYLATSIILRLLYLCGLRVGEACSLRYSDIDFQNCTLRIVGKGNVERLVHADPDLIDLISRLRVKAEIFFGDQSVVFPSLHSKAQSYFGIWNVELYLSEAWEHVYGDMELMRFSPHTLRHVYIMHRIDSWIQAGENPKIHLLALKEQTGHNSIESLYYYYHQVRAGSQAIRPALEANNEVSKRFLNEIK